MRAGSKSFISAPYPATERENRSRPRPDGLLDRKRSADDWSVAETIVRCSALEWKRLSRSAGAARGRLGRLRGCGSRARRLRLAQLGALGLSVVLSGQGEVGEGRGAAGGLDVVEDVRAGAVAGDDLFAPLTLVCTAVKPWPLRGRPRPGCRISPAVSARPRAPHSRSGPLPSDRCASPHPGPRRCSPIGGRCGLPGLTRLSGSARSTAQSRHRSDSRSKAWQRASRSERAAAGWPPAARPG